MDDIDIDDYSRDTNSPVRDRSKSPSAVRRDYEAPKLEEAPADRSRSNNERRGGRRGEFARRERGEGRSRGSTAAREDRNYDNSIFIGNIPFTTTSAEIQEMFGRDFKIVEAVVISNRGKSRGMATVEFENKQDVAEAISKFDKTVMEGREIFVRQDYPPPDDKRKDGERNGRREERAARDKREKVDSAPAPPPGTELFVGNLPYSTTWQQLKDMMRNAGEVVRADVMQTKFGKSRGFGTVLFATIAEAQNAIDKYNRHRIEGREIEVRFSRDSSQRQKPTLKNTAFTEGVTGNGEVNSTIYAGNLPFITTETDLYELFETIGRVNKAEIQYNDRGRPNGSAVVEFENPELADIAIRNLHGYNYGGRDLQITYARRPVPEAPVVAEPQSIDVSEPAVSTEAPQASESEDVAMAK